jgi:dihydroorotate dehydrogenase (fumarate)
MDPTDAALAATMARFPEGEEYPLGPDAYAEHVRRVKQAVHVPVIGSLNGISPESWLRFARIIEQAGADALELNLYEVITDIGTPAVAVESQFAGIVREVKRIINIPIAVRSCPISHRSATWRANSTSPALTGWCSSIGSTRPTSISGR